MNHDDYHAIVRTLGAPAQDRDSAHYVGAMDANWHVIHYVELAGGGSTASLLRALRRF